MEVLITIIQFLVLLAVVVVVHEAGHFFTAKMFGVQVHEFGFGFPPRLLGIRKGETVYTINLIPLGGFVRMEGENDPSHPRSLASKGVGTRFIILTAGVFMNTLLWIILLTGFFMFTDYNEVGIRTVAPGSPAEQAGVLPGDVILKVNRNSVNSYDDLAALIDENRGREVEWLIRRDGVEQSLRLVPRENPPPGQGATGISINLLATHSLTPVRPPWEAADMGVGLTKLVMWDTKDAITGAITSGEGGNLAGPIGIAQATGEIAREAGIVFLIPLAAFLSISLAIFNILPIPALDGGRLVFVILEWVRRGKRIPPEKEGLIHLMGFVFVIAIAIIIGYNDIMRIIDGTSLTP
jgi:regulator of sigma E protease